MNIEFIKGEILSDASLLVYRVDNRKVIIEFGGTVLGILGVGIVDKKVVKEDESINKLREDFRFEQFIKDVLSQYLNNENDFLKIEIDSIGAILSGKNICPLKELRSFVGIKTRFIFNPNTQSKEELKKAGADYVLENFKNINKFLEIIF